ncbi:tyrosine-type recombinase/integrase [Microbacterium sp. PRC9]|uniref:tyrosine-type recombinase/integrase n=1 Tax=Microbacterium sp. PRC9 TaxID=2962591 RepID=UPI002881258E|nr:tyrosine-type recombinase/integrase [Microbacterium sp. PRC9]MDT0143165.1 tyrosine-type recombinase/integrase [Microbacterium sp. PRC9]
MEALAGRMRVGGAGDGLTADSPFSALADAWLDDLRVDPSRSEGTKEVYERELNSLVLPTFQHFTIREITVGRVEHFLKTQHSKSYARAKHSRTILSMILAFAVRREMIARNPVKETSRLKKPKHVPKALTTNQIRAIRIAARDWRTGPGALGPHPDGQVREIIELMLGSLTRIGEVLALRKCDVDMAAEPPTVHVCGTIVVRKGIGVLRQHKPKTDESNRVVAIPTFAAAVVRHRLAVIPGDEPEHLLFYSRKGTPLAPHNVRRTFREIVKRAGLDGLEITPHAFRRTGATLLTNELGIETAADILGHTSTKTTKEHYAEPDRAVNPIPAAILERLAPAE